jgi:NAD(P)-dependent dehydrogenase (short-subunit alcohol dehydrogenase family)
MIAYGVSKGALLVMTRKLAGTLRKDRIRVNWITVGWVKTEMEEHIHTIEHGDLQRITRFDTSAPWGLNTKEDVASGCVYLASDEAVRVTGTNLNISGGIQITV